MILNKIQARKLFKDIYQQSVKRLGHYNIGKYNIKISLKSVDKKYSKVRSKRLYNKRISLNLCPSCGEKNTSKYIRCDKCRKKIRENYRKN